MERLPITILESYKTVNKNKVEEDYLNALKMLDRKIIVLDDDPTGIQTVHSIYVYTSWDEEALRDGFLDENRMFFILTNSRGLSVAETKKIHIEIGKTISKISQDTGIDYLIISRSDSTMRGHYPLETEMLKESIESTSNKKFDGEIIVFFFKEGGRYTINNIHYVKEVNELVPAAMTEFAQDKTFGYLSSNIGEYIEEKTNNRFNRKECIYISIEDLRSGSIENITSKLISVNGFHKIVVNAIDYTDIETFTIALIKALSQGKEYILRGAASITRIIGGVQTTPLLTKSELVKDNDKNGGLVIIGSHVNKTTSQIEALDKSNESLIFIEFNQHLVTVENGLEDEVVRVINIIEENILKGKNIIVYTKRERFDYKSDDKEKQLELSIKISEAITSIVAKLKIKPKFIIAKGGITSSEIGTKALKVKRAKVLGQIKPGIPVWLTDVNSKFPNMPYIIFPGNVGEVSTLKEIIDLLS